MQTKIEIPIIETNPQLRGITIEDLANEHLSADYVAERQEKVIELTSDIIDDIHLQNLRELYGDITEQVCCKTGRIIGHVSREYITMGLKMLGEENAMTLLQRENIRHCAFHWLRTDSVALNELMQIDPRGYFIYAASYILSAHSPMAQLPPLIINYSKIKDASDRSQAFAEWKLAEYYWIHQKATAFKMLHNVPLETVVRINEVMRGYLALFEAVAIGDYGDVYLQLLHAGETEFTEILPAAIANIEQFETYISGTASLIVKTENLRGNITYSMHQTRLDQLWKIKEKYNGYANFRQQRRLLFDTDTEEFGFELDKQLKAAGVTDMSLRAMDQKHVEMHGNRAVMLDKHHTLAKTFKAGAEIEFKFK